MRRITFAFQKRRLFLPVQLKPKYLLLFLVREIAKFNKWSGCYVRSVMKIHERRRWPMREVEPIRVSSGGWLSLRADQSFSRAWPGSRLRFMAGDWMRSA